jgi:hypothetical protein
LAEEEIAGEHLVRHSSHLAENILAGVLNFLVELVSLEEGLMACLRLVINSKDVVVLELEMLEEKEFLVFLARLSTAVLEYGHQVQNLLMAYH